MQLFWNNPPDKSTFINTGRVESLWELKLLKEVWKLDYLLLFLKLPETYLYLLESISQFFWPFVFKYPRIISSWQIKVSKMSKMSKKKSMYKWVHMCVYICVCVQTYIKYNKKKFFNLSFFCIGNTNLRFLGVTLNIKYTCNWKEMAMFSIVKWYSFEKLCCRNHLHEISTLTMTSPWQLCTKLSGWNILPSC